MTSDTLERRADDPPCAAIFVRPKIAAGPPIDWPTILATIRELIGNPGKPASEVKLAEFLGHALGTVRGWRDGSTPRHHDGETLVKVWGSLTGRPESEAPRRTIPLSAAKI